MDVIKNTVTETPVVDIESGYALNIPLSEQGYPWWWEDYPEIVSRLRMLRATAGIEIDDFPNGIPTKRPDDNEKFAGRLGEMLDGDSAASEK